MKPRLAALPLPSTILVVSLVGACSLGTAAGPTQQAIPRVALMHVGTDHNPPSLATLVAALGDLGWYNGPAAQVMQQLIGDGTMVQGRMKQVEGQHQGPRIELIWRNLDPTQPDQIAEQARAFVRDRVSLIVAFEDKSIRAAQDATADPSNRIPVVFLHPSDPVRDGLVQSLAHPGGNLTGVWAARDPMAKQLEIYRQTAEAAAVTPTRARRSQGCRQDVQAPRRGARRRLASSGSRSTSDRRRRAPTSKPPSRRSSPARWTVHSFCLPACGSTSRARSSAWQPQPSSPSGPTAGNGSTLRS